MNRTRMCATALAVTATLCTLIAPTAYAQDDPVDNRHPSRSPDGRIAFMSDRDGDLEIYLMNADGSGVGRRVLRRRPGEAVRPVRNLLATPRSGTCVKPR